MSSVSSAAVLSSEGEDHEFEIEHGASSRSSAVAAIHRSSSSTSAMACSPFHLMPDETGYNLIKAVNLGSRLADNLLSDNHSSARDEGGDQAIARLNDSADTRDEYQENATLGPISFKDVFRNNTRDEATVGNSFHGNHEVSCNSEARSSYRQLEQQEPTEDSIQCRRTINVEYLRDRAHHRTSFLDGLIGPLLEVSPQDYSGQATIRRVFNSLRRNTSSESNSEVLPDPPTDPSYQLAGFDTAQHQGLESPQQREVNNHDFLEHATAFHERRRRVISQVRTLQRLGSRFENLSDHQRSCILSGQHRTGHCTCRGGSRPSNHIEDAGTRASISRIVMLVEALFEVLDEIHQQTELLSSQPFFSSIGSVPAPKEIVESMPTKTFTKPQKSPNGETEQCYICLLEYEERDYMRILPCNHEFHQTCIDKWLKEIHRVCPLCRGDVCKYEPSNLGKPS